MTTINISDLDKAEVLAALFNASHQQGMGFMHTEGRGLMTVAEARELLTKEIDFDYLRGRVMKIRIEDNLDPWLYDRDNGQGAAERAIASLRAKVANRVGVASSRAEDNPAFHVNAAWPFPSAPAPTQYTPEPEREPALVSGGGGDFGGGGASSSWGDSSSSSSSSSDSSSSSSSDSGSSCSSSD